MSLRVTILGCGSSGGVPRIGNDWGACDPANPRNRRSRCAVLIERRGAAGTTVVLVDTTPDVRGQLLDAGIGWLDAVFYTHDHADHTHGIDDLRVVAYNGRDRVNVYADEATLATLQKRFDYCFRTPEGSGYPAILRGHVLRHGEPVWIKGAGGSIELIPFNQIHGNITSLGFRVGGVAYSSDLNGLPEESLALLERLEVWIVDALRYTPHPSHFSVKEALEWIERICPARAILTHLHVDLDYETLRHMLPPGVEPAYDGMVIELPEKAA